MNKVLFSVALFVAAGTSSLFAAPVAQGSIIPAKFNVTDARLPSLYSGTPGTPGAGFFFCTTASITPVANDFQFLKAGTAGTNASATEQATRLSATGVAG